MSTAVPPAERVRTIAKALQSGRDFVEVGRIVCDLGRSLFGLHQNLVTLNAASGRPLITVDNIPRITDEFRLRYFAETWVLDPVLRAAREHHAPVGDELMPAQELVDQSRLGGYTGDFVHTLILPILEPAGLIGTVACGAKRPFSVELRRDLCAVGTHVSLRLVQLGVTTLLEAPALRELTPRQFDVATLASRGRTNAQIAEMLELSENTVKKHLKEIFTRVGVSNRTQLAALIARVAPRDGYPRGVTKLDTVTVTKAQ